MKMNSARLETLRPPPVLDLEHEDSNVPGFNYDTGERYFSIEGFLPIV